MTKLTQGERIVKIEAGMNYLKDEVTEIKAMLKEHVDWETEKYDSLNAKFANKWVEKAFLTGAGIVGITLIGALLKLIIQ